MKRELNIRFLCGASMALALTVPAPVNAQDLPSVAPVAASSDDEFGISEIVVTGRKRARSEELQNVPLSVSAFGAAQLSQPVIVDMVDIGRQTPGASLQPSAQRGVQNFSIRGMGVSGTAPSDEPAVGVFQDGVFWGTNYGTLTDLFDLESVEIFRGPQGTLFGRNVTGGAITIRSARPSFETGGQFSFGAGNGGMFEASAVATGALVDEKLAGRIAMQARTSDGLFHDIVNNSSYGGTTSYTIRPSLYIKASDDFNVTLIGEYFEEDGSPTVIRGISPSPLGPTLAQTQGFLSPSRFHSVFMERGFSDLKIYFGMVEANLNIGPGVLTSISGYRKVRYRGLTDFDGTPARGFLQNSANDQNQFTSELRYAADVSEWIGFTAGLYYFNQEFDFRETRRLNNYVQNIATRSLLDHESYAAFAEIDIKPLEDLTITLGGRYTDEKKSALAAPYGSCSFDHVTCNFGASRKFSGSDFTPKVGLSYEINDDALIFASYTKGFRSGGFSLRGTVLVEPYEPESVSAFEGGFKTDFFDRRLRVNASAYYNKYKDLQRTVIGVSPSQGVVQATFNAASAVIQGAEIEVIAIPVRGLTLSANYGYTDAEYRSFQGVADPKSRKLTRVPKHTLNASAQYSIDLANGDNVTARTGVSYTGKYFFDDPNFISQKGYALLDANVAYTFREKYTLAVYAKNLTNTKYNHWGVFLGGLGHSSFPADPRSYGFRVTAKL